jgi:hypothetical protein
MFYSLMFATLKHRLSLNGLRCNVCSACSLITIKFKNNFVYDAYSTANHCNNIHLLAVSGAKR